MNESGVIITIDGPAGTGKSSVARALAQRLCLEFLDTGAMYRAAALLAFESGLAPTGGDAIAVALADADLHFDWSRQPPALMLASRDVTARLRDDDVEESVSEVSAQAPVRRFMVSLQRQIARRHPRLVSEGRDQGSVVFPDAALRFYLDASPQVRARRRFDQLRGERRDADLDEILRAILDRDRIDSTRAEGPLRVPEGALRVQTDDLDREQVIDRLEQEVRSRVAAERLRSGAAGGCAR